MEKIERIITTLGNNSKILEFDFINNFKKILPYILEEKNNKYVNIEKIEKYLNEITIKGSPKKGPQKLLNIIKRGEEINFFIPWGFRYYTENMDINENSLEYISLKILKEKLIFLKKNGIKFKLYFMNADSYASEINDCDKINVIKYYENLRNIIEEIFGNEIEYKIFNYSELTKSKIFENYELDKEKISEKQKQKLEKQSKTLGSDWQEYVRNRQFEGFYINTFLKNSIKISFASQMDDEFDGELSSLYIIPKELQKPWAKIKDNKRKILNKFKKGLKRLFDNNDDNFNFNKSLFPYF